LAPANQLVPSDFGGAALPPRMAWYPTVLSAWAPRALRAVPVWAGLMRGSGGPTLLRIRVHGHGHQQPHSFGGRGAIRRLHGTTRRRARKVARPAEPSSRFLCSAVEMHAMDSGQCVRIIKAGLASGSLTSRIHRTCKARTYYLATQQIKGRL
jgi:hypothetical protein